MRFYNDKIIPITVMPCYSDLKCEICSIAGVCTKCFKGYTL